MHGNQVYEEVVLDRLMKNEAKRQKEEEEAKRRRDQEAAAMIAPDLSDEEANEDIRRELERVKAEEA